MAGPMSLPEGSKSLFAELNEVVCDIHFTCDMSDKSKHDYITYREWLSRRGRLRTGKTV